MRPDEESRKTVSAGKGDSAQDQKASRTQDEQSNIMPSNTHSDNQVNPAVYFDSVALESILPSSHLRPAA